MQSTRPAIMVLAIATGRGDSLYSDLRKSFDSELHGAITVGYYPNQDTLSTFGINFVMNLF